MTNTLDFLAPSVPTTPRGSSAGFDNVVPKSKEVEQSRNFVSKATQLAGEVLCRVKHSRGDKNQIYHLAIQMNAMQEAIEHFLQNNRSSVNVEELFRPLLLVGQAFSACHGRICDEAYASVHG